MSTPSERPNCEIVDVLRRDRRRGQRHARRVDALVLADLAAFDDRRLDLGAVGRIDAQLDETVGQQQPVAWPDAARQAFERRRNAARTRRRNRPSRSQARRRASRTAARDSAAGRCGSSGRRGPAGSPTSRRARAAAARTRAETSRPATRACRARNSGGRCRCRRRSARRASRRSRWRARRWR